MPKLIKSYGGLEEPKIKLKSKLKNIQSKLTKKDPIDPILDPKEDPKEDPILDPIEDPIEDQNEDTIDDKNDNEDKVENEDKIDNEDKTEDKDEDKNDKPLGKITFKKPLKGVITKVPIQFGKDGLPIPNKDNVDRMSYDDLAKFCDQWTLDKHINQLIIELSDFLSVKLPMSANKILKCDAILKYKKENPSGSDKQAKKLDKDIYESFNWMSETVFRYRGKEWVMPYSPDFRNDITARFSDYTLTDKSVKLNKLDPNDPVSPFKYQDILGRLLDPKTPYRGLLAYHGIGSGKTRASIMVSSRFLNDNKKVVVLLPGALRGNFIKELYQWGSIEHNVGIKNYRNLKDKERMQAELIADKAIKHYYDILTYNEKGIYEKLKALTNKTTGMLENRLIIIDEIHNLVSRMSKATNLSRKVYHFLMENLYNCKLLYLSGSPLLNSAYELGVLFNTLRGKFHTPKGTFTLFPENHDEFNDKFVNIYDKTMINYELFKRRTSGLISYYAGTTDKEGMPEIVVHPVSKIEMAEQQYILYQRERFSESRKERKRNNNKHNLDEEMDEQIGSAFRTYSRMVCNFAFPQNIIRPKPISSKDFKTFEQYQNKKIDMSQLDVDDIMDEIDPSKIEDYKLQLDTSDKSGKTMKVTTSLENEMFKNDETDNLDDDYIDVSEKTLTKKQREETYAKLLTEALIELEKMGEHVFGGDKLKLYSPKMWQIRNNIRSGPGSEGLIYIYTEFRILEGVRIMGSVLQYDGYQKINYSNINSFEDFKKRYPAGQKRYGIISSDEDSKQRKLLLEIFNHPENSHGEYVKIIMGTSASSEGINLFRVRQIHIMEPYWNMVRNEQVAGRGARYGSHTDLPPNEQNVNIFSYQITLNELQRKTLIELLDNPKEEKSTDEHIHNIAIIKQYINTQFLTNMKEGAVDCALNYMVNVKINPDLKCLDTPIEKGKYMYVPDIDQDPEDQEYNKNIKFEDYKVGQLSLNNQIYGYKVDPNNGRPILGPSHITHEGKIYHQIITLYDFDLLNNGVEIKRKYYVLGTAILIDA